MTLALEDSKFSGISYAPGPGAYDFITIVFVASANFTDFLESLALCMSYLPGPGTVDFSFISSASSLNFYFLGNEN